MLIQPQYKAIVYAPRSVDPTEATVLTPLGSSPAHTDPFQVATMTGLAGFQPYLDIPEGRTGTLDVRERKTDTGQLRVTLLDKRTTPGGSNLERWATTFTGDASGGGLLNGRLLRMWESLDNGATWDPFFTGRITAARLTARLTFELQVQDLFVDLDDRLFTGTPYPQATTAQGPNVVPVGLAQPWGPFPAAAWITGRISTSGTAQNLLVDQGQDFQTMLTQATYPLCYQGRAEFVQDLHVDMTWSGGSGTFKLTSIPYIASRKTSAGIYQPTLAAGVDIFPLDNVSEPGYSALPANGTAVSFRIYPTRWHLSEALPLLIDDTHPVTLIRWILDGYFGERAVDGTPTRAVPRYTGTGTPGTAGDPWYDLEQDLSFGTVRFVVTEVAEKRRTWITDAIGKPCALAITLDESGLVRIIDLRARAGATPVATLTNADVAGGEAPSWSHVRDGAISRVESTYHLDEQVPLGSFDTTSENPPPGGPARVISHDVIATTLDLSERALDASGKPLQLDCLGFRAALGEVSALDAPTSEATPRDLMLRRQLNRVEWEYRRLFGAGPMAVSIPCRRTVAAESIRPGNYFLATIDELVDPATRRRGAQRLYLCTSVATKGLTRTLSALDCGANAASLVPTVSLAASTADPAHRADVTVTPSADLDPVAIDTCVTDTGVATRPADTDARWQAARVLEFASGTPVVVTIDGLPSGRRLWVRAAAIPAGYSGNALPSSYVYPATTHIDTTAIAGPTAGSVGAITVAGVPLSWTNTNTVDPVDVFVAQGGTAPADWTDSYRVATLPPGSTGYQLTWKQAAGTAFTWLARCRDATGGVSAGAGTSLVSTSTAVTAPTPGTPIVNSAGGVSVYASDDLLAAGPATAGPVKMSKFYPVGISLALFPSDPAYTLELQRTTDSGGAPNAGAWATIALVPGWSPDYFDPRPLDGVTYWYRCRSTGLNATASEWSGSASGVAATYYGNTVAREGRRRTDTLYQSDGVVGASVAAQRDTGSAQKTFLAKGLRSGTCRHGDNITFSPAFAGTPVVWFGDLRRDQQAAVWSATIAGVPGTLARLAGVDVYPVRRAVGVGAGGFTAQLLLMQKGTQTLRGYDFSGVAVTAAGGVDTSVALAIAPSATDQYTVKYAGSIDAVTFKPGFPCTNDVVVAIEVAPDGITWSEVWRTPAPYSVSDDTGATATLAINELVTISVASMGASAKIRVKLVSATKTGSGSTSQTIHGWMTATAGEGPGVTFYTSSGNQYASATPDADDAVDWHAMEGS